jgi:hypothetical protein
MTVLTSGRSFTPVDLWHSHAKSIRREGTSLVGSFLSACSRPVQASAGNIIAAIATTNAIIAGLIVLQVL